MKIKLKVLSLFDGISGAQLALERAGIKANKYYASEVDKYAIQITQKNFPNTIQLGDVTKWREWDIEKPDLIIGGFPCQPYSVAGTRKGLDDKRGGILVNAMFDVIKKYSPEEKLLENVKGLLSSQNRERLYFFCKRLDKCKGCYYCELNDKNKEISHATQ